MAGRRYMMFSGGAGSYRAAKIDRARHPDAALGLVFTDVLYEDADTYRFLIEGAADVLGRRLNWSVKAEDSPDYRVAADVPIEEYAGNPEWRAFLADLRARTIDALPELTWLVEGRDPWEIFRDERFLGNSQKDPCSKIAKRLIADDWRMEHCIREGELFGPADVFGVGIGVHERHRFDDGQGGGIGPRNRAEGWLYHAPIIDAEDALRAGGHDHLALLYAPLEDFGLATPRLYGFGNVHGNCGGFCIKAGHAHFANRYRRQPERYAYDAMMERKLGAFLGGEYTILTDRRGGEGKKPMSLEQFAARLRAEPGREYEYEPGEGGCGCMIDADEAA